MRRRRPGRGDDRPARLRVARLEVRLQPGASRDEIAGERAGRLLVRVTAPPLEGRANAALCKLVAKRAGMPRGAVRVVRGQRSRDKTIAVDGLSTEELQALLSPEFTGGR